MVRRLVAADGTALTALLSADPITNLFPLACRELQPIEDARWYGCVRRAALVAAALFVDGRLAVPCGQDPSAFDEIGRFAGGVGEEPCLVVGPRAPSDALWRGLTDEPPAARWDQELYVLHEPPPGPTIAGLRRAVLDDWPELAANARAMEIEDLGRDPHESGVAAFEEGVRSRIRSGRTWVIVENGRVAFQVNVTTWTWRGAQLGGTWVPLALRGRGLATAGVAGVARAVLDRHPGGRPEVPFLTLHVTESNTPAVRAYRTVGFRPWTPFRVLVPRPRQS